MTIDTWNVRNTDNIWSQNYYIYEPLIHPLCAVQEHKFKTIWDPIGFLGWMDNNFLQLNTDKTEVLQIP